MALVLPPLEHLSREDLKTEILAKFFRGLGDPSRLRILRRLLREGNQPVKNLVRHLGSPQARVSTHLACLRWCGYVQTRKEGRQVLYSISDPRIRTLITLAEAIMADNEAELASCLRIDARQRRTPWKRTTS